MLLVWVLIVYKYTKKDMKTCLQRETTNGAAPESNTLFDELDLARWVFLQLVGKQYPIKAFQNTKNRKRNKKKTIPRQREPALGV